MVNDRRMEETPAAEVSTTEGPYGVRAVLDSGVEHRCAARMTSLPSLLTPRALVGRTQQILQIRFTVLDVLRPIIALSCLVQGGWDLSFGGAPVEDTAAHRGTQRRLGLIQRTGLYFIPLFIAVQRE
eukprot:2223791-Amphidinium_carterae.5